MLAADACLTGVLSDVIGSPQAHVHFRRGESGLAVTRVVSGGQTGVDRAALDVAGELGLAAGGWVPKGRLDELGRIPERYLGLVEAASADPAVRTRANVAAADATLILTRRGARSPGTDWTRRCAEELGKPVTVIELEPSRAAGDASRVRRWLTEVRPAVLNVAGPRESEDAAVYCLAKAALLRALRDS
jgi:Circularly permutated YpsA SLOG family